MMQKYLRALSTLTAVVIIVGVTLSITVVVALWVSGIITSNSSYGTGITKIEIYYIEDYGVLAKIVLKNTGSTSISIDRITVNGRTAKVKIARDLNDPNNIMVYANTTIEKDPFILPAGHMAEIWIIPPISIEAGVMYRIGVHLSNNILLQQPIKARISTTKSKYQLLLYAFTRMPGFHLDLQANGNATVYLNDHKIGTYTDLTIDYPVPPAARSKRIGIASRTNNLYLYRGDNLLAIMYNNTGNTIFNARLLLSYTSRPDGTVSWLQLLRDMPTWKYWLNGKPSGDWWSPSYNDSSWNKAKLPMGKGYPVATKIILRKGKTIYLRGNATIPSSIAGLEITGFKTGWLRVSSDDNVTFFINGKLVLHTTSPWGAYYWNYVVRIDPKSLGLKPGNTYVLAANVTNMGGAWYFDYELCLEAVLSNGDIVNITIPSRPIAKIMVVPPGATPPTNWWSTSYDDSSWATGYLPIGLGNYSWTNTVVKGSTILIRIHFSLNNIPIVVDSHNRYNPLYTGFIGKLVVFDMVSYTYSYYKVYNPTGDPRETSRYIIIGKDGKQGSINDVLNHKLPAIYTGKPHIISSPSAAAEDFETPPTSPIIVLINKHTDKTFNLTWTNLNGFRDKFVLQPVRNAIPGMDILILWEDLWSSPEWHHTWNDGRAFVDHVVRVTWLENGDVQIGVYRCSGSYLHTFMLASRYVYFKPHKDSWGDDTRLPWTKWIDGILVHWEIGYNPITHSFTTWVSPTSYKVTVWTISP